MIKNKQSVTQSQQLSKLVPGGNNNNMDSIKDIRDIKETNENDLITSPMITDKMLTTHHLNQQQANNNGKKDLGFNWKAASKSR